MFFFSSTLLKTNLGVFKYFKDNFGLNFNTVCGYYFCLLEKSETVVLPRNMNKILQNG